MCFSTVLSSAFLLVLFLRDALSAKINLIDCGVDHEENVLVGDVHIEMYPWLGILYYNDEDLGGIRAVTPVVLIQENFLLANAHDIAEMPVDGFRKNARVLLGEGWHMGPGRRVRTYVLHPEYGETYNTLAIVYMRDGVRNGVIKPICPPPEILKDPEFYVVRFDNDYNNLQKQVLPMYYVPGRLCKDFYVAANLYAVKLRPPHVVCACSIEHDNVCVWEGGATLVSRDVWGRWQLLGFGVRGPGCASPSRYLDMASYYPWIHEALRKFQPITISKISNHKYVLRAGGVTQSIVTDEGSYVLQRYGVCDESEKAQYAEDLEIVRLYRDYIRLTTDNTQYQFLTYNVAGSPPDLTQAIAPYFQPAWLLDQQMSIYQAMEITCMTLELINASASSEMKMRHYCPRETFGPPCYQYRGTVFDISVYLMFADKCTFEINVWGAVKDMKLITQIQWRWEEGTYYEDFTMSRVEYRGPTFMTSFGFEPLDTSMWLPNLDMYTTTEFNPWLSPVTTTPEPSKDGSELFAAEKAMPKGVAPAPRKNHSHPFRGKKRTPTTTKKFFYHPGFLGP